MAPWEDIHAMAASVIDYYELLSITPTASETEIRSAYRKTSLKYHPDKVGEAQENRDKFDLLQDAYKALSDPTRRAQYDQSRAAAERKRTEDEQLKGRRRQMKKDLERREGDVIAFRGAQTHGVKRRWGEETTEEKSTRENEERIAEKHRRLVREMREDRERERRRERRQEREAHEEEERRSEALDRQKRQTSEAANSLSNGYGEGGSHVPVIQRTVRVRLIRNEVQEDIDKDRLAEMFGVFGKVEATSFSKDKKQRLEGRRVKKVIATGLVLFASIGEAHTAVEHAAQQTALPWKAIESVRWAEDKGPEPTARQETSSNYGDISLTSTAPAAGATASQLFAGLNTKARTKNTSEEYSTQVPSFGSFSSAASSKESKSVGANAPSFEELTLMKLRNKQREIERKLSGKA